jgi:hypothetical protein
VGLLHPIVVTPGGRLIAGQRRLEASQLQCRCEQLSVQQTEERPVRPSLR